MTGVQTCALPILARHKIAAQQPSHIEFEDKTFRIDDEVFDDRLLDQPQPRQQCIGDKLQRLMFDVVVGRLVEQPHFMWWHAPETGTGMIERVPRLKKLRLFIVDADAVEFHSVFEHARRMSLAARPPAFDGSKEVVL